VSEKLRPNFTPIPNILLDDVMGKLSPGAVKILFGICRFTYGWGKTSDRISLSQLQAITGLSRWSVVRSLKQLGDLVTIKPGSHNLASEYTLNIEISSKDLVTLSDQSQKVTSHFGSHSDARIQRKPKKDIANDKHSPKTNGRSGRTTPSPDGFKETMLLYHELFVSKFGVKPDIDGGRDGKLLSGLVKTHGAHQVLDQLRYFFKHPPDWVEKGAKFTIPAFKSAYTEVLAKSRNGKSQMGVL
jgi:Bacteriophage replication protein O